MDIAQYRVYTGGKVSHSSSKLRCFFFSPWNGSPWLLLSLLSLLLLSLLSLLLLLLLLLLLFVVVEVVYDRLKMNLLKKGLLWGWKILKYVVEFHKSWQQLITAKTLRASHLLVFLFFSFLCVCVCVSCILLFCFVVVSGRAVLKSGTSHKVSYVKSPISQIDLRCKSFVRPPTPPLSLSLSCSFSIGVFSDYGTFFCCSKIAQ